MRHRGVSVKAVPLTNLRNTEIASLVDVKVAQSCPTLCDPMDYTDHEILQARILEWVASLLLQGIFPTQDQTQVFCIAGRFFTN